MNFKGLGRSGRGLIEVLSQHSSGGAEKPRKSLVPTEIQTGYLPNRSQERYGYLNLLTRNRASGPTCSHVVVTGALQILDGQS
jgi:hypothetical protein